MKRLDIADVRERMRVAYIPVHAYGDLNHPDVEHGIVSSKNNKFVFVKFDKQLNKFGWDGTTSQSCNANDLTEIYETE